MEGPLPNEGSPVSHCAPAWCQVHSGTCSEVSLHLTLRCGKILASNKLGKPLWKVTGYKCSMKCGTGVVIFRYGFQICSVKLSSYFLSVKIKNI